jgi:hypothetical protein
LVCLSWWTGSDNNKRERAISFSKAFLLDLFLAIRFLLACGFRFLSSRLIWEATKTFDLSTLL